MDERIITLLVQAIVERRCALFVGPDLGESAAGYRGLPNSWQLAAELAKACDYTGRLRPLPWIAQIYERRFSRRDLEHYLQQRLGDSEYRPLPVHELIARIPFPVIVSGGWDLLLEQALDTHRRPFRIAQPNTIQSLDSRREEALLFKPYGSVRVPAQMRITEDDQESIFYDIKWMIDDLRAVVRRYTLVLIGYNLDQDSVFARIYHSIRRPQEQERLRPPAFAIYAQGKPEDGAIWDSLGISTVAVGDPSEFLSLLAARVAEEERRELLLPPLSQISSAPRLTSAELAEQAVILNSLMDQLGVADLVERTEVPLLSDDQLRDIDSMRLAYERLTTSLATPPGTARIWLRQGNLEYVRGNYTQAELFYRRAHSIDKNLPEVYHNMHFVRLARGDWASAMKFLLRAVRMQPDLAILPPRYQIREIIGSSEFAVVYRADDASGDGSSYAVKVMHHGRPNAERVLRLFQREAEALRALDHPRIVSLVAAMSYRGSYFIATRFLPGPSLRDVIRERRAPLDLDWAYRITCDIGSALSFAHEHLIIHRDVKPSNILIVDGHGVLIDFGLARPLSQAEQTTVLTGGTLAYMAPEQAQGQAGSARSDVYGLASVFYEMLTGRSPGQGNYRPASEERPDLTSAIDLVIEKGREFSPNDRYPSIAAFLEDLHRAMRVQETLPDAPAWVRRTAAFERLLYGTTKYAWWALVLIAALLGIAGLSLDLPWQARGFAQVGAAALLIVLLLTAVMQWFVRTQRLRLRGLGPAALLASYGGILGLALGGVCSALWLRSMFIRDEPNPLALGKYGPFDYAVFLVIMLTFSLVSAGLLLLLLRGGASIAQRRGWQYASGFLATFGLFVVMVAALAALLPPGWFGIVDTTRFP